MAPTTSGAFMAEKDSLTNKADSLYNQKEEEEKQNTKLSRDKVQLIGQIATLERALQDLQIKNAKELQAFVKKAEEQRAVRTQTVGRMAQRKKDLEQHLGSTSIVEAEVVRLRGIVQTLQDVAAAEKASNSEKEEEVKKHAFNVRKQLEELSRKTLRELNQEFEDRAKAAMKSESENALAQNTLLSEELAEHSAMVLRLMDEHQNKHDDLRSMRMERDLLRSQVAIQAQRVEALTENKAEYEEIIVETQAQIAEVHEENRKLAEHEEMVQHSVEKLRRLEAEKDQLMVEIGKGKANALRLTRQILGERQRAARAAASIKAAPTTQSLIEAPDVPRAGGSSSSPVAAPVALPQPQKPPRRRQKSGGGGGGGGAGGGDHLAIWSTSHFSNADLLW
jgi:hypothetical protein